MQYKPYWASVCMMVDITYNSDLLIVSTVLKQLHPNMIVLHVDQAYQSHVCYKAIDFLTCGDLQKAFNSCSFNF